MHGTGYNRATCDSKQELGKYVAVIMGGTG